mmetsp:Transcript_105025/g.279445  ORF Transcript_105025/g.279445 Transcript_105025/m.279445 type:complete len:236 (+) Transcript_105025:470-1177(+)
MRRHGQPHWWQRRGLRHRCRLLGIGARLRVDPGLWQVVGPLADEDLAALRVEERATALSLVVQPIALVAVAVGLVQGALAGAEPVVPLANVEVAVLVAQGAMAVHLPLVPVALEELAVLEEASPPAVPLVVLPAPYVQLPQLLGLAHRHPQRALPTAEAVAPLAFVLLPARVDLDSVAVLLVVVPLAVVAGALETAAGGLVVLAHDALSNPVDGASLASLLCLHVMVPPEGLRLG